MAFGYLYDLKLLKNIIMIPQQMCGNHKTVTGTANHSAVPVFAKSDFM